MGNVGQGWTMPSARSIKQYHQLEQRPALDSPASPNAVRRKTSASAAEQRARAHSARDWVRWIPLPIPLPLRINIVTNPGVFAAPGLGNLGNLGRNTYHGPAGFYSDCVGGREFPGLREAQCAVPHGCLQRSIIPSMLQREQWSHRVTNLQVGTTGRSPAWKAARPCGSSSLRSLRLLKIEAGFCSKGGSHGLPPYFFAVLILFPATGENLYSVAHEQFGAAEASFGEPRRPWRWLDARFTGHKCRRPPSPRTAPESSSQFGWADPAEPLGTSQEGASGYAATRHLPGATIRSIGRTSAHRWLVPAVLRLKM